MGAVGQHRFEYAFELRLVVDSDQVVYHFPHHGTVIGRLFRYTAAQNLCAADHHHRHRRCPFAAGGSVGFRGDFIRILFRMPVQPKHQLEAGRRLIQRVPVTESGPVFRHAHHIKALGEHVPALAQRTSIPGYGEEHPAVGIDAVLFQKALGQIGRFLPLRLHTVLPA